MNHLLTTIVIAVALTITNVVVLVIELKYSDERGQLRAEITELRDYNKLLMSVNMEQAVAYAGMVDELKGEQLCQE